MPEEIDMNKIFALFEKDHFAVENGMRLIDVKPGYAQARMDISSRHRNGFGAVMGGALFTLADYAFAAASNAKGNATVSSNASISYFLPPKGQFVTAKASEVSSGRRLCTYNVDIFDEDGTLVARYTCNGYIKKQKSV
jgi:acyl-CoA thioesterase